MVWLNRAIWGSPLVYEGKKAAPELRLISEGKFGILDEMANVAKGL